MSGEWGFHIHFHKPNWKKIAKTAFVASTFVCSACAVAYGVYTAYNTYRAIRRKDWAGAAEGALSAVPFGAGRGMRVLSKMHGRGAKLMKTAKRYSRRHGYAAEKKVFRQRQMHHLERRDTWAARSRTWRKRFDYAGASYDAWSIWR